MHRVFMFLDVWKILRQIMLQAAEGEIASCE